MTTSESKKEQQTTANMIDTSVDVDQALSLLKKSADQAVNRAESAARNANSAFTLVSNQKKVIEKLTADLSSLEKNIDLSSLQLNANIAARAAFATLVEIKGLVVAASDTLVHTSSVKSSAAAAQRAAKRARISSALQYIQKGAKTRSTVMADSKRIALEMADKAKSSFLANMSHEIRTPLAAIVGFAEILAQEINGKNPDDAVVNHVDAILRNSKHLLALINDVLDISKIDSGAIELQTDTIVIRDEIDQILQMLDVKATQHNDKIFVNCHPNIPAMIKTDGIKLRQILINLISNSIKFTEHGSIRINVDRIVSKEPNKTDFLRIQIMDTGIGIASVSRAKLFSSYGQADRSTSRRFGGTGLGLMLAKKLAQAMGGDVFLVSSTLGFGSTFEVQIPLLLSENIPAHTENNLEIIDAEVSSIKGCRVLLAEDSSDMQNLVGHIVTSKGGEIQFAKNGRDAIEKATEGQFDMILMDVEMPVLDGNEANKQLRKQGLKVPIIAFTAHAFINKEHFNDAIYDDYLTKPITSSQLVKTINRWYQPRLAH